MWERGRPSSPTYTYTTTTTTTTTTLFTTAAATVASYPTRG